ncbi:linker histone H1M [Stigmatopora nigra]
MPPKRRTVVLNKPANRGMPDQEFDSKPGPVTLRKMTMHPGTSIMVSEALKKLDNRKGVTKQGIQNFIKINYPSVDPIRLNYLVRRVLLKGLENGTMVRPTNATIITGVGGRFRLAKNKETKAKAENLDPNVEKPPKEAPKTKAGRFGTKRKPGAVKRKSPKTEAKKGTKKSKIEAEAPPAKVVPTKADKADGATEEFKKKEKSKEMESVKTKAKAKDVKAKDAKAKVAKAKEAKSKVEKEPKTAAKRGRKKKIESIDV